MSKEILCIRKGSSLVGYDALAEEEVRGLPEKVLMVTVKAPRSVPFDRLYRACLKSICDSGGFNEGVDALHAVTKISCGHFKVISMQGLTFRIPDSIAHSNMDAIAFRSFFDRALSFWMSEGLYRWISKDLQEKLDGGER